MKQIKNLFILCLLFTGVQASAQVAYQANEMTIPALAANAQAEPIIVPIKLLSFEAVVQNNRKLFQWRVAENETGYSFEMQKSTDGTTYTTVALIFTSENKGTETYLFKEPVDKQKNLHYRLKIIHKDGTVAFSDSIAVQKTLSPR